MAQYNIFGEIEEDTRPETIEEIPEPVALQPDLDTRKPFVVVKCSRCSQKLFVPKGDKGHKYLCQDCNPATKAKFDKFKNFALIAALRVHKYLG